MAKTAVQVTVIDMDHTRGYALVGMKATGELPCTFTVMYDTVTGQYVFRQTGENNEWACYPDERK